MPCMQRMVGLMVALGWVACAASSPLAEQTAVGLANDPPARSCRDSLPRSMEDQQAASAAPCLPKTRGFFVLEPPVFDGHDNFGGEATGQALGSPFAAPIPAGNGHPPAPPVVRRCGVRMLNKTAVPYCVAP